jgi:subtilase family serine protease
MNLKNPIMRKLSFVALALAALVCLRVVFFGPAFGQFSRVLITEPIDEGRLVTLAGNTRPEARNLQNDRGAVPDDFPMEHMFLQLKRSPESEQALKQFMDEQQDKRSPNFRHWLMPAELGQKYGLVDSDIEAIKAWLLSHGFSVGYVYPTHMVMDISGTAGKIREAFHTEIHYLDVNGELHFANMSDPQIPKALTSAVAGIVQMHNFKPHHFARPRVQPAYNLGAGNNELVPADWQTIYNISPLYRAGIYGQGQTIVVVEDTNSYGTDFTTYQTTFGLNKYGGSLVTVHPNSASNCTNPGTNSADSEADLDVEMVAAIAPGATVELASCSDGSGNSNFGGLIAVENLVSAGTPPAVISMSYGECEATNGATANAAFSNAFQSAAAAGVSVFVSSGDDGTAACSGNGSASSTDGIGITGWGDSVYNVSVGGTDFEDNYNAVKGVPATPASNYWRSINGLSYGSALSYVPEIPWNNSCAGYLLYNYNGKTTNTGSTGFCNSGGTADRTTGAGSGGPSGCFAGTASTANIVTGTCTGVPKPSWQSVVGNPADGVRDIPDVAMFAANGIWGHYTVVCWSDPAYTADGSTPCTGSPSSWSGFGGTSIASPVMASIQALVNQKWGIRAGLPTPTYYAIARAEFGSSSTANPACYAINLPPRRGQATSCVFNDITQGDIVVNTTGTHVNSYLPSSTDGAVSTQPLTGVTVLTAGSGYTSAPTCTLGAPSNLYSYVSPTNTTLWAGGTQATCTAVLSGSTVGSITLNNAGQGYNAGGGCTLSGGGGSGATCVPAITATTKAAAYQPAYGTTPGWDFATGLGSVNAYNLVFNSAW